MSPRSSAFEVNADVTRTRRIADHLVDPDIPSVRHVTEAATPSYSDAPAMADRSCRLLSLSLEMRIVPDAPEATEAAGAG